MRRSIVNPTARAGALFESLEARTLFNTALDLIGVTALRADPSLAGIDGSGVTIAVLDAGVNGANPSIAPALLTSVDLVGSGPAISGHGTAVAGVAGSRDAGVSVAPAAGLVSVKVLADSPTPTPSRISEGLRWVLDNRARYNILAVNLSIGDGHLYTAANSGSYAGEIRQLEAAGIVVVASAGNEYFGNQRLGATSPGIDATIVVGAVWPDGRNRVVVFEDGATDNTTGADRLVSFSNRWDGPSYLLAPGAAVETLDLASGHVFESGTSIAAPMVAGAVALVQDAAKTYAGRYLAPGEVVQLLKDTARSVYDGDDEDDNVTNSNRSYLRIDVDNAVKQLAVRYAAVAVGAVGASFLADPGGDTLTLTATGATSSYTPVSIMVFYVDFDRDGVLEPAEQIGQDHDGGGGDGWSVTITLPGSFAPGVFQIGAVGINAIGTLSPPTTATPVLKPSLAFSVVYPEGFANESTIDEFVPLVNPNASDLSYRVIAHYEVGPDGQSADAIIDAGTIPALSRAGITVSSRGAAGQSLVGLGRGYAIEVESTLAIGATLSHYDNFNPLAADAGVATGEAFTTASASSWRLARVEKRAGSVFDFLVYYNPQDASQTISAAFYAGGRQVATVDFTARARGRGGLSVADLSQIPDGVYGVVVTAAAPVVVALSHYVSDGTGDSSLATPALATGSPSVQGVLPLVDRADGVDVTVVLSNPTSARVNVTLSVANDNPSSGPVQRIISVAAFSSLTTTLPWGPGEPGRDWSVQFRATGAVAVAVFQNAPTRGDSTFDAGAAYASDAWAIADGFIDRSLAGSKYFETLSIYNPGTAAVTASIDYLLFDYRQNRSPDGRSVLQSLPVTIPAGRSASIALQAPGSVPLLAAGPSQVPYSIVVRGLPSGGGAAGASVVVAFSHWDLIQGGGWSTLATPLGGLTGL